MSAPATPTIVIPARLASARLPRKMLRIVGGKPLLQWTWENACASGVGRVVLAVDHEETLALAHAFGAQVVMTDPALPSGTDRCRAAAKHLGLTEDCLVINIQGDEPLLPHSAITEAAALAQAHAGAIGTAAVPIGSADEAAMASVVKIALAEQSGRALYFSRAAVPYDRVRGRAAAQWRHLGIYAMRFRTMQRLADLPASPLEQCESLEQLRALENGIDIYVARVHANAGIAVDTVDDLAALRRHFTHAQG